MRSAARHSVAIGAIAIAVAMVGGAPLAYGAPACDGGCNVTGANGGSSGGKGGSHGAQPTVPTAKLPPPAVINAQTVVETAPPPPPPPPTIPPPAIAYHQPTIPVETQPVIPANVVPVLAPVVPVPAEIPAPPSAPPAPVPVTTPVSLVLFTSSMEPGTQAATLIVLFMASGCWIYANRIGGQITPRKNPRATTSA